MSYGQMMKRNLELARSAVYLVTGSGGLMFIGPHSVAAGFITGGAITLPVS